MIGQAISSQESSRPSALSTESISKHASQSYLQLKSSSLRSASLLPAQQPQPVSFLSRNPYNEIVQVVSFVAFAELHKCCVHNKCPLWAVEAVHHERLGILPFWVDLPASAETGGSTLQLHSCNISGILPASTNGLAVLTMIPVCQGKIRCQAFFIYIKKPCSSMWSLQPDFGGVGMSPAAKMREPSPAELR